MITRFALLWPERRIVGAARIALWYEDALANGELELDQEIQTPADKATALHRAGLITLAKGDNA